MGFFWSEEISMSAKKNAHGTRQVNLALTPSQEDIVRLLVTRLREGGVEYEERLRSFLEEPPVPRYMHIDDLDRRFGAIERRLEAVEEAFRREASLPGSREPRR
jgi:hypothetical protein